MAMDFLQSLGIDDAISGNHSLPSYSPTDGKRIGAVALTTKEEYDIAVQKSRQAFVEWRNWPAP
ncbi:aldehyde dehydrogenase family protein, partial [Acinetobacter baumannii]